MIVFKRDSVNRISVILGVAEGPPEDFIPSLQGDFVWVLRTSLDRNEVAKLHFSNVVDENNNSFSSAADTLVFLQEVFSPFPPVLGEVFKIMACDSSLSVGSWVYQSPTTNSFVVGATDNNPPEPILGKVVEKPSTTEAKVLFSGLAQDTTSRGRIFLSTTGTSTNTPPTTGFVQRLGISFGDGTMLVSPELHRVKKL